MRVSAGTGVGAFLGGGGRRVCASAATTVAATIIAVAAVGAVAAAGDAERRALACGRGHRGPAIAGSDPTGPGQRNRG